MDISQNQRSDSDTAIRPFRVLALDGGGIRGYYTAKLLAGLLKSFETRRGSKPLDLGKGFDLIAGTSTGGLLAAGLAIGKSPEVIARLYREKGPAIFPNRFPSLGFDVRTLMWALLHWNAPNSSQAALQTGLEDIFGDVTLADVWRARAIAMVIPAVSIEKYGPKVFKTPHHERYTHDRDLRLVDICLATSAAPLFFPLHAIGLAQKYFRDDLFVDGGLWANNPSLVGMLEAIQILSDRGTRRPIQIFSFGTCAGRVDQSHLRSNPRGGLKTWNAGKDVTELTLATSANAVDEMMGLFANALSGAGTPVMYGRIPDPEMNSQQQASLGMDKADDEAFEIMDQLAATNEARILSGMTGDQHRDYRLFGEVMQQLPESSSTSNHERKL
jgi:predicted acylesterase/phospholipase RssA